MINLFRRLRIRVINFRLFFIRVRLDRLDRREDKLVRRRNDLQALLKGQ